MAKFCTKCGKPLEDGKPCNCNIKQESEVLSKSKTIARNYTNLFFEILKGLLKTPIDVIKKYATEKNFGFGVMTILFNALIFGLFFYSFLKESVDTLEYGFLMIRAELPFLNILLTGAVLVIVGIIVVIAMIYVLAGVLFKSRIDYKTITALLGTCSVLMTVAMAISVIAVFLSIELALFILLVASLFDLTYLCQGILEITNVSKNKLAYIFVPTVCVTLLVVVYILPKFLF